MKKDETFIDTHLIIGSLNVALLTLTSLHLYDFGFRHDCTIKSFFQKETHLILQNTKYHLLL